MYKLLCLLLFRLDPETAHALTHYALRSTQYVPLARWVLERIYYAPAKPVHAFGLTFKNPVGMAAGYDKDGVAIRGLAALGFGHIEIGTVTPLAQPGNPRPRMFRLMEDRAVINRMGFPSKGAEIVHKNLQSVCRCEPRSTPKGYAGAKQSSHDGGDCFALSAPHRGADRARNDMKVIIGVNLGKNKDTPLEEAARDYLSMMSIFAPLADYLAINVSSPNTVGLRRLQGREMLEELLTLLAAQRQVQEMRLGRRVPMLVKLAPDLTEAELDDALEVILRTGMDGVIATNTTLAREGLRSRYQGETGGLSGEPLKGRSGAVLTSIVKRVEGRIPVVSVGGIMSPEDAKRRLDMGAALVQVYTGLIYEGPGLVKNSLIAITQHCP